MDATTTFSSYCPKHHVAASTICSSCGYAWCRECVVPPRRAGAPTYCVDCALRKAGVRVRRRPSGARGRMRVWRPRPEIDDA